MISRYLSYLAEVIILFLIYFITARIGLAFDAVNKFATLIWFPSGISFASLLLFGADLWPGIFLAAFLVNLLNGASSPVALGIGVGNTLEAVIGYYVLKQLGYRISPVSLSDTIKFILIAPLSALASATIGIVSLLLGHIVTFSTLVNTWRTWWVGDAISILVLTPFFLIWRTIPHIKLRPLRVLETVLLCISIIISGIFVFGGFGIATKDYSITYLIFPPLIWASLRFGQRGAVSATCALSLLSTIATLQNIGSFSIGTLSDHLLPLQYFIAVIAVTSLILSAVDTERRELEQRKDEFISLASHELKTPITSMKIFTQTLQRNLKKTSIATTHTILQKMGMQINKTSELVNDLLDISKMQAQKLEIHNDFFSLGPLITDTIDIVKDTAPHHTIIVKNVEKNKDLLVYADKQRIGQVLTNLLSNATKYSPNSKKVVVTISSTRRGKVQVSVKDFGVGIPWEHQEKIFQRYYRVYDNSKFFPGLGVGLYISSEIVSRSGGNMWVKSKVGKGSTFYFTLPLRTRYSLSRIARFPKLTRKETN